jgi:hypothetical protein
MAPTDPLSCPNPPRSPRRASPPDGNSECLRVDTLFSADAINLIHHASRGYARAINNLAIGSLIAAFAHNNPTVDEKAARTAITETGAD